MQRGSDLSNKTYSRILKKKSKEAYRVNEMNWTHLALPTSCTFRLRFDSCHGSFASNLEQVANLLCAEVNSASYPEREGKWVLAYGLWGEGRVWLIGAVACLLAANCGSSCSLTRAMDGRIVRRGIISSCQSAPTSEIVKSFWSRVWLM